MAEFMVFNRINDGSRIVILTKKEQIEFDTVRNRGEFLTGFVDRFCKVVDVIFHNSIMIKFSVPEERLRELIVILKKYPNAQKVFGELVEAMQDGTYEDKVKEIMKDVILEKLEESNI